MNMPKVYVIVLNWNGAADTCACVDSLLRLTHSNTELVICDNASQEASLHAIREWAMQQPTSGAIPFFRELDVPSAHDSAKLKGHCAKVTLIHTGGNLGYAGGMNVGVRYAMARQDMDLVWILNNDTVVDENALTELVARVHDDPNIGICGSSLIYFDQRTKVQAFGGASYQPWRGRSRAIGAFSSIESIPLQPHDVERATAYVIGASMLVTKRFIDTVGLMDETYFLYSEEQDWALRGRKADFSLGYAPRSFVFHKHGASIGTSPSGGSTVSLFYLYRAKLMFTMRHYALLTPVVILSLAWEGAKFALKGKPDKAIAVGRGLVAAFSGGGPR
ncbi:glycosyltransferase family 2 protein [Comamonadaceae bacterium G21597-S1]|nr:glycosyltransferase family 2 protein [Comamonadaceae bacterium G21597-S1]